MKKTTILLIITFISIFAFGRNNRYSHRQNKGIKNQTYFRIGYSIPSWKYFYLDKNFYSSETKRYGATFELGNIFMIKSLSPANNIYLGLNIDYLYTSYTNFDIIDEDAGDGKWGTFRAGSKIGPSITFSPQKNVSFDFYAKADIPWATVYVPYQNDISDADDYFFDIFSLGYSTGLNFRYEIIMLGIEFNTIYPELESDDMAGFYFQEFVDLEYFEYDENKIRKKSKLPYMNFTVGISF